MNKNAPFVTPYKSVPPSEITEKLASLEKQLHFVETRLKDLEMMYLSAIADAEEDISESLGSEDSVDEIFPKKFKK